MKKNREASVSMPEKEKMVLHHEPVPGYRTAFYVILAAAVGYLGCIFVISLF